MKTSKQFDFEEIKGLKVGFAPIGKPSLQVNVYFIDGLLIDTGQSRMRKEVLNFVEDLEIEQIFITHHHEDHTGNLVPIKSKIAVPVYGSDLCIELMKNPPPISLPQRVYWGTRPAFEISPLPSRTLRTTHYRFDIIEIPGHAKDMIGLYEKNKGWFFSGDLYINSFIGYMLKNEEIHSQISSIKSVLQLDFDVLLCAHNPQFKGGKEKLKKKLSFLESFYEEVASLHQKGHSSKEIIKKLKLKEYWMTRIISAGDLSKLNMVESVIRAERAKYEKV